MKKIKLLEPLNLIIEKGSIVEISDTQFLSLPKGVYEEIAIATLTPQKDKKPDSKNGKKLDAKEAK